VLITTNHNGGLGLSKPIALLMKEDKLLLGSGVQSSVLGLVLLLRCQLIMINQYLFSKVQKREAIKNAIIGT
jgi:hypothetical protein